MTGDVEPAAIVAQLERAFAGWTAGEAGGASAAPIRPAPPTPTRRRLIVVHVPGATQAVYRIGHLMPPARADDWVEITIMNTILGGPAGWLTRVLREQKGYTYAAYSAAQELSDHGSFAVRTAVRTAVADSALGEVLRVLERIRTEPMPADDLTTVKNLWIGAFPLMIETPQQVATQVANTLRLGRSTDYLETFRTRIAALTPADIERVARTYLHPDRAVIVVVGDARQLLEKLRPFADTVELSDPSGRPLTPASLSGPE
ncbi:MAG: insulinase family protein [Gemmatimonadaceae bacterium]